MKANNRKHRTITRIIVSLFLIISFFARLKLYTWPKDKDRQEGDSIFQQLSRREKREFSSIKVSDVLDLRHQKQNITERDPIIISALVERTAIVAESILYSGYIFLDWSGEADDFGYLNYKCLESLLYALPNAKFLVHIIGPAATNYYKFTGLLSKHTFQKYIKYGFNLRVDIIDDIVLYHSRNTIATGVPSENIKDDKELSLLYPGYSYSKRAMTSCCQHKRAKDISAGMKVPYHLIFFNRIVSLYQYGGVYSDFSWLHLQEATQKDNFLQHNFSEPIQGVILKTLCDLPTQFHSMNTNLRLQRPCIFSSLLVFSKNNPVLQCMLTLFGGDDDDEEKILNSNRGSSSGSSSGGGGGGSSNSGSSSGSSSGGGGGGRTGRSNMKRSTSLLLPKDNQSPEESLLACIAHDQRYEGALCIQRAFDFCFARERSVNFFAQPSDTVWAISLGDLDEKDTGAVYSSSSLQSPSLCVDLPYDANSAIQYSNNLLQQKPPVSLCLPSRGVLWMGANGNRFTWQRPEEGSILSALLKQVSSKNGKTIPLQLFENANTLVTQRQLEIQNCFREVHHREISCSHYSAVVPKINNIHKIHNNNNTLQQARQSCAPKFVIAGLVFSSDLFSCIIFLSFTEKTHTHTHTHTHNLR